MKSFVFLLCLIVVVVTGCTTNAKARRQSRASFAAGQQQALIQQQQRQSVTIIGNVQNAMVPWSDDLTLATAILAADYRGFRDPRGFVLHRNGQSMTVDAKELLRGQDFDLQPGDSIEIVP